MKSECNIIRDLLPLYIEDMASDDTAVFVENHLEQCPDCRQEMNLLKNANRLEQAIPDPAEAGALRAIKEKIKRHNKVIVAARTTISTVILCALLISLIVYHFPQRRRVSMPVCTAAGDTAQLEIDVKYYRRLFSIPWVKGTVTFDGETYIDVATRMGKQQDGYSFWDWVWYFGDPDSIIPSNTFFMKEKHDPSKVFQDELHLFYLGEENTFDAVFFYCITHDDSPSPKFYGPASTVEEAKQLAEEHGWRFD